MEPGMLCVSIHDVAPATWADCLRLVQAVRAVADIPLTWLVVPHYHFRPDHSAAMEACLDVALDRGDELALHGYSHLDTEADGGGLRGRFLRTVYTRREGEFAALCEAEARRRLELGLDWFAERGWTPSGFVPPAWLLGEGAWRALRGSPFTYTTTFSHFHCLPGPHDTWHRPGPRRDANSRYRRDRRDRRSQQDLAGHSRQGQADAGANRQGEAPLFGAHVTWDRGGSQGLQPRADYQGGPGPAGARGDGERRHAPGWQGAQEVRQGRLDLDSERHAWRGAADGAGGMATAVAASAAAADSAAPAAASAAAHARDAARADAAAGAIWTPERHAQDHQTPERQAHSAAGNLIAHPGKAILSPSLVYAARNRGGRLLSPRVVDVTAAMLVNAPLIRFSLHPPDARYPDLVRHIQQVLERLLEQREAVTKAECARRLMAADAAVRDRHRDHDGRPEREGGFTSTAPNNPAASSRDPSRNSPETTRHAADRASY